MRNDDESTWRRPRCPCGRDLRTDLEKRLGECRRCTDDDDTDTMDDEDFTADLEMRT